MLANLIASPSFSARRQAEEKYSRGEYHKASG
jgi:hypothetical protein